MTKKGLERRLKSARKRLKDELKIVDDARDRVIYWRNVVLRAESRLNLVENGQIEMNFNKPTRGPTNEYQRTSVNRR